MRELVINSGKRYVGLDDGSLENPRQIHGWLGKQETLCLLDGKELLVGRSLLRLFSMQFF